MRISFHGENGMRVARRNAAKQPCASAMPSYTFRMQNTKYNIWQDENGWRGYLEGYPQHEAHGNSFQDLQVALWQLHQHLSRAERQLLEEPLSEVAARSSEATPPPTAVFRLKSRVQIERRARVERLMMVFPHAVCFVCRGCADLAWKHGTEVDL